MAASAPRRHDPRRPSHRRRDLVLLAVLLVFLWSTVSLGFKLDRLVELPAKLASLFEQMFLPPDWGYLSEALAGDGRCPSQMAWIGTLIGAALSLPLGFFAAHNVSPRPVSVAIRVLLDAIRAFPEIVLAVVIFVPIAGLGPFAGALAIGIHSVGTLGKLTAEAIESIDPGPVEAARASGASRAPGPALGRAAPGAAGGHRLLAVPLRDQRPRRRRAGGRGCGRHRVAARRRRSDSAATTRQAWSSSSSWSRRSCIDQHLRPGAPSGHRGARQRHAHRRAGAHRSDPGARRGRPAACRRIRVLASVPPTLTREHATHIDPASDAFILRTRESRETEELSRLAPAAVRVGRLARPRRDRSRPTGTARRSSATGTGSSTPRHSGA